MNKVSTAVYLLIAIAVILLALVMAKPEVVAATNTEKSYIKLFNFSIKKA